MDRRKFLLGSVGVAAHGALGKLAPTPIVESIPEVYTLRISVPSQTWRMLYQGNPFNTSWIEDRFHIEPIPLEDIYA